MVNVQALTGVLAPLGGPRAAQVLEATGFDGVERMSAISGLDKDGYVSRSLLSLRGDPRGLLRLVIQKPLTAVDLDLIPRDATFAFAWKLDAQKAWATIMDTAEKIDPKLRGQLGTTNESQRVGAGTGRVRPARRELIEELSKALGDTWCVFDSPSEGGGVHGRDGGGVRQESGGRSVCAEEPTGAGPVSRAGSTGSCAGACTSRSLTSLARPSTSSTPCAPGFPLAPAWCLTDDHLVVALYPEAVKAFLRVARHSSR